MKTAVEKVKDALADCLVQMKQASKMFEHDPKWQQAIENGDQALDEFSKAMAEEHYSLKELDAGLEIANIASVHGYRSLNGRDTRNQYINWAVEFESKPYEKDNRIELIKKFADQKMLAEIEAGRSRFSHSKISTWLVDSLKKEPKLEFDPTAPENYLQVMGSKALQLKHQDALDACFTQRLADVTNKLRNNGWEGENNPLTKDRPLSLNHASREVAVYFKPAQIGDNGNIISGVWNVLVSDEMTKSWKPHESFMDGLAKSTDFIADKINRIKDQQLNLKSAQRAVNLVNNKLDVLVADKEFKHESAGVIMGRTGQHIVQNTGKSAVIYKISDLDHVPEKGDGVTINFKDGRGKVTFDKNLTKDIER